MLKVVRTTIAGGLIFLLPVAIIALLVGKIFATVEKLAKPFSDQLPIQSVAGVSATIVVAVFGIIAVSFLAGVLAKTRAAQRMVKQLESRVLGRVPAYGLIKSLSQDLVLPDKEADQRVVLIQFDDAWQIGVKMGDTMSGTHTVIFLPDSPTPQSGTVQIVETGRVHDTDIPLMKAFAILSGRGAGLPDMLNQVRSSLTHESHSAFG